MAKMVLSNPSLTLDGIAVATNCDAVELVAADGTVVITAFGDTYEQRLRKQIRNWSVRLNYFTEYSAGSNLYLALKNMFEGSTTAGLQLVLRPTTAIRSGGNPDFSGAVAFEGDWGLLNGAVGEANKGTVTLVGLGTLTVNTAST